ncbi:MAG: protein kinase [Fibrobacterota bacterium]
MADLPDKSGTPENGDYKHKAEEMEALYHDIEHRYQEALQQLSEQKSSPIHSIAGMDQKVVQVDTRLRIVYCNTPLARMLGFSKEGLVGAELSKIDNFQWGPGYLEVLVRQCGHLNEPLVKERGYFDLKAGQEVMVRISVRPVEGGFQIVMEDRTEYAALQKRFARYVSPKILEAMKALGTDFETPRRQTLSVLFVALRGFTALTDTLPPEQLRETLNLYLTTMISIVEANDAMVDKILGDQLLVLCGAPLPRSDHGLLAVKIAFEMMRTHEQLIAAMARDNRTLPNIGIGIHPGEVTLGNFGTDKRNDYTAMGQTVQVAARLCQAAREGEVLVSHAALEEVVMADASVTEKVRFHKVDSIEVKGMRDPVPSYRVTLRDAAETALTLTEPLPEAVAQEAERKRIFGRYQLLNEIGRGGMGVVYKAIHTDMGKVVALKFLKIGDFAQEAQLKMFQREIEALATLQHPHIIAIHDVGVNEGQRYFAMDYIEGSSLDILLAGARREGREINVTQALTLMVKILRALDHAHGRGIVHRDLKPSNIMITREGEPVIMDFGLARQTRTAENIQALSGQILGTPAYMSPEQADGRSEAINEKSDVYSMGALFFEMLTGRTPHGSQGSLVDDLRAIVEKEPQNLRRVNPAVPVELAIICHKALEKEPERRYRTAGAFAEDLQRYINGDPIQARPQSLLYRARKKIAKHRVEFVAACLMLLFLLSALAYRQVSHRAMTEKERALAGEIAKTEARWVLAYRNDFNGPALDSAGWYYRLPQLNTLAYGIEDSALTLRGSGMLYSTLRIPGNIRLVFDACIEGANEIHVRMKVGPTYGDSDWFYNNYWAENVCVWERRGMWNTQRDLDFTFHQQVLTDPLPARAGQWQAVEMTFEDGRCRTRINDRTINEGEDYFPLNSMDYSRWGFRSITGSLRIRNLRVYKQRLPERLDVTQLANERINRGEVAQAGRDLLGVFEEYDSPEIVSLALRKILMIARNDTGFTDAMRLARERPLIDKIFRSAAPALRDDYMRWAVSLFRNPACTGEFDYVIERFTAALDADARFSLYVYLGLSFNTPATRERSRAFFLRALVLRPDTLVERMLRIPPGSPEGTARGRQKWVGPGYLPSAFGCSRRMAPFYMDSIEVTQAFYRELTGDNPSNFREPIADGRPIGKDLDRPVENVSWYEAVRFCNLRSAREGRKPAYHFRHPRDSVVRILHLKILRVQGVLVSRYFNDSSHVSLFDVTVDSAADGYRLPTADEFEYALRGGTTTRFFWGDKTEEGGAYAWLALNNANVTHAVAALRPGPYGLYDIAGNVSEWCWSDGTQAMARGANIKDANGASGDFRDGVFDKATRGPTSVLGFRCVSRP